MALPVSSAPIFIPPAMERVVEENVQMTDKPVPPSPEKAPRYLKIGPQSHPVKLNKFGQPTDPEAFDNAVRRALFVKGATRRYHDLCRRDLTMCDTHPNQYHHYFERSEDYLERYQECKAVGRQLKRKIANE